MLTQTIIFIAYILFTVYKFGVLPSISDSWYKLGTHWYWFTALTWGLGLPLIWMDKGALLSVSGILMCFVGIAGAFKNDNVIHIVHYTGAACSIIFAFVYLSVNVSIMPVILMAAFLLYAIFSKMKNSIWWIEIVAFTLIEVGLLIGYYEN